MQTQSEANRPALLRCADLKELAAAIKDPEFLVEGFIPASSIGILVGEWGVGKSPLAIQLQFSVASGINFLDRFAVHSPSPVLYIDLENPLKGRVEVESALTEFLGLTSAPSNAYVYGEMFSPKSGMGNIDNLKDLIHECKAKLVIIDPLRAFNPNAPGKNETAAELINKLRPIAKEEQCSILILHHPVKPKEDRPTFDLDKDPTQWMQQASGAAALVQNVDFRIAIESEKKDGHPDKNRLKMKHFLRLIGWQDTMLLVREFRPDVPDEPLGYRSKSPLDELEPGEREDFLSLPNSFTPSNVKEVCGVTDSPANKRIDKWQNMNLIRKARRGEYMKLWVPNRAKRVN
jgi:archaellum biogenesis ATPase FlaH